jgi:glucosyl-dolichyl phosphate glucuronosyltransferase
MHNTNGVNGTAIAERSPAGDTLAASVIIACHTEKRFGQLLQAIGSALDQVPAPLEVIVAVDHNEKLCARLRAEAPGVAVVDHRGEPGASGARNAGAARARGSVLVFLDDDTRAHPGWLAGLLAPFADAGVVGTGGRTLAAWQRARPGWFPDEFGWVVGASYTGLPVTAAPVRNVWSENMAVRRAAFEAVGGFRAGFGKVGNVSRPEDTDLCIRVGAGGDRWMYVPGAVVDHAVPAGRSTFRFFVRRCYWEGAGKAELAGHLGEDRDLGDERAYLTRTLPRAVLRDLARGRIGRAAAIVAGVSAAAAGGTTALLRV